MELFRCIQSSNVCKSFALVILQNGTLLLNSKNKRDYMCENTIRLFNGQFIIQPGCWQSSFKSKQCNFQLHSISRFIQDGCQNRARTFAW